MMMMKGQTTRIRESATNLDSRQIVHQKSSQRITAANTEVKQNERKKCVLG